MDIEFVSVKKALPETNGNAVSVYIKQNDKICKGMFYMNGGKPVFASYGSTIENVEAWAYYNKEQERKLKNA